MLSLASTGAGPYRYGARPIDTRACARTRRTAASCFELARTERDATSQYADRHLPPAVQLPRSPSPMRRRSSTTCDALGISHAYTSSYLSGRARQHARLRRRRPDAAEPRDRRRARATPPGSRRCARTAWGTSSTSCPTTWASRKSANPWWQDVLENGASSRYAARLRHRLASAQAGARDTRCCCRFSATPTAPCWSGRRYALEYEAGAFRVRYFEHVLPIAPGHLRPHPRPRRRRSCSRRIGRDSDDGHRVPQHPAPPSATCPAAQDATPALLAERDREKEVIKRRLDGADRGSRRRCWRTSQQAVAAFNGDAGDPASFDALDDAAVGAGLPARLLARGGRGDQLPALLRHQRAGGHPHGGPGGVRPRRTPSSSTCSPRTASTASASTTSTASTIPATTCSGCRRVRASCGRDAVRRRAPLYVVVEKILGARRSAAGLAGRRHDAATTSW